MGLPEVMSSSPAKRRSLPPILSSVLCLASASSALAEPSATKESKDGSGGSGRFSINDVRPVPDASSLPPPRFLETRTGKEVQVLAPHESQTRLLPPAGGKGKGHARFLDTYHGVCWPSRSLVIHRWLCPEVGQRWSA
jgi:hypothetical protein